MIDRLNVIENKYNELTDELSKPETLSDIKKMTELSKEQVRLGNIVEVNCIDLGFAVKSSVTLFLFNCIPIGDVCTVTNPVAVLLFSFENSENSQRAREREREREREGENEGERK